MPEDLGGQVGKLRSRVARLEHRGGLRYDDQGRVKLPGAVVGDGHGGTFPIGGPLPTAPDAPTVTPGSYLDRVFADVEWDPVDGAVSYEVIARRVSTGQLEAPQTPTGTSTRFRDLEPNQQYGFRVYAIDSLGRASDPSPETVVDVGQDTTVPPAVAGVTVTVLFRSLVVRWTESTATDVRGGRGWYEVQLQRHTGTAWVADDTRRVTATLMAFPDRASGTRYRARVAAIDSSANIGPYSDWIEGETPAGLGTVDLVDRAVTLAKLDGTVTAHNLVVGSFENLLANPGFETGTMEGWTVQTDGGIPDNWIIQDTLPRSGAYCARYEATNQTSTTSVVNGAGLSSPVGHPRCAEGDRFYFEAWTRGWGLAPYNRGRLAMWFRAADGSALTSHTSGTTAAGSPYTKLSVEGVAPAGAAYVVFGFQILNDQAGTRPGRRWDDLYARRMIDGELVVEGTIYGRHIAAGGITADDAVFAQAAIVDANIASLRADKLIANSGDFSWLRADEALLKRVYIGNGGTIQIQGPTANVRQLIDASGIRAFNAANVRTLFVDGATGNVELRGVVVATGGEIAGNLNVSGSLTTTAATGGVTRFARVRGGVLEVGGSSTAGEWLTEIGHATTSPAIVRFEQFRVQGSTLVQQARIQFQSGLIAIETFAGNNIAIQPAADLIIEPGGTVQVRGSGEVMRFAGPVNNSRYLGFFNNTLRQGFIGMGSAANNDMYVASDTGNLRFNASGNFIAAAIGGATTSSAGNTHVTPSGIMYRSTSSEEFKADIRPMTLEEARRLLHAKPIRFRGVADGDNWFWTHYGFTAQQVRRDVDVRLVHLADDDWTGSGLVACGVQYERFIPGHTLLLADHDDRLALLEQQLEELTAA